MKLLVIGANGQLGREIVLRGTAAEADPAMEIIGLARGSLDITDLHQCKEAFRLHRPDVVIHCAAYTAVDQAETDAAEAFRVNGEGTQNVALAAEETGAKLCFISTDYVFDGLGRRPYTETDPANPQTVYGKSKLQGEQMVQTWHDRFYIVRTSWVYGRFGNNFVNTMLKLAQERDRIKVVSDQIGSPTYTSDLADFIIELVDTDKFGLYHASNAGACSWYDFDRAIFEESGYAVEVQPCTTSEFPRPAKRPLYSVLDHAAIRTSGFTPLRPWREALTEYIQSKQRQG